MEKILLIINAEDPDIRALKLACYIAELTGSKITGVFLENQPGLEKNVVVNARHSQCLSSEEIVAFADSPGVIEKRMDEFKETCAKRSVRCSVHRDRGVPAHEIITESRYADLLILSAGTSFNKSYAETLTELVKNVLRESECPVIIAPDTFDEIEEIIFTTNFNKSSTFAIKQFAYLFPELNDKKVIVLQVNEKGICDCKEKHNLKEWLQNRYSSIGIEVVKGNTEEELFDYLLNRKKIFVVMGAYGRNAISRFFKRSHSDLLIRMLAQPIFITYL